MPEGHADVVTAIAEDSEEGIPGGLDRAGVCRRLQLLSRMEHHEQDNEQVFP